MCSVETCYGLLWITCVCSENNEDDEDVGSVWVPHIRNVHLSLSEYKDHTRFIEHGGETLNWKKISLHSLMTLTYLFCGTSFISPTHLLEVLQHSSQHWSSLCSGMAISFLSAQCSPPSFWVLVKGQQLQNISFTVPAEFLPHQCPCLHGCIPQGAMCSWK